MNTQTGNDIRDLFDFSGAAFSSFLSIMDSIYDGILIADKESIVRYINPEYTRITGVTQEQIIGRYIHEVRPGAKLPTVISRGKAMAGVYRREGDIEYVVDMAPIMVEGKVIGGVSVVKDITEIQRLGKEIRRYEKRAKNLKFMVKQAYRAKYHFEDVICDSSVMRDVVNMAKRVARGQSNILITGESGTGKELIAQAIHNSSLRADGSFVALNCAALTPTLVESELFGYEEGAFTGAKQGGRIGAFEIADGGTILLDEIGELSLDIQAKLLRVLQEQTVRRVGESAEVSVDVRVIACTNRDLLNLVKNGQFREDLYYRLNVLNIHLPPLRERRQDIPALADTFLQRYSKKVGYDFSFADEIYEVLIRHRWPGNVRELNNVVEFAANMCEETIIKAHNLPKFINVTSLPISPKKLLAEIVREAERRAIEEALAYTGVTVEGKQKAASNLGISRATLYNKIKELGISHGLA